MSNEQVVMSCQNDIDNCSLLIAKKPGLSALSGAENKPAGLIRG
jgi:hypothetical protein